LSSSKIYRLHFFKPSDLTKYLVTKFINYFLSIVDKYCWSIISQHWLAYWDKIMIKEWLAESDQTDFVISTSN
jgi:hypothetical protein